ncbi:DUF6471 domain-containing protein [Clostridium tertium]|uniref:Phosphoribosylglycinamide formyltransferase n=1 Tax=Clostridium tertium TaxID=1559 RepID=A0A9X3XKF6_9CLOT|nr:LLM class flavin-dependent oxidoreductase [Clostridium tertium]MDC4241020.1 hypothetical protein [Clostridium tertium]
MAIKDDLKSYIVKKGYNVSKLNEELNKKNGTEQSVQNLNKKINNETIRYNEVLEIAEVLGYKIEWVEK